MSIPLPLAAPAAGLKPCTECGKCCTYVSVGINPPRTIRYATDILWYLYHDRVSVYRDGDGDWSVVFETRCRNLQPDLLCGIYPERPLICRDFDNTTCEVNDPAGGRTFATPAEFLEDLKVRHPGIYRNVVRAYVPAPTPRPGAAGAPLPAPSCAPDSSGGAPASGPPGRPR